VNRSIVWLLLLHLIGNALLLWLGYYWLGVGESDAAHLAWSVAVIVCIACAALWLHGMALVLFNREAELDFGPAIRTVAAHLPALFTAAIGAAAVYGLLAMAHDSFEHSAFVIGSYATMKLRRPVPPSGVLRACYVLVWLLRWMVVPMVLFRLAASVALRGWRGFRLPWRTGRTRWHYAVEVCALLVCAIWVPLKLVNWIPHLERFALQMASFLGRLGVAYLLFVFALLAVEFVTSAGRPRLTQPSTASSP
jgi:hypothetical protein